MLSAAVLAVSALPVLAAEDQQDPVGRFDIERFELQGNTLLSEQAVDEILTPFTGKGRNFGDVQQALEALEGAYRKRGFHVVQVALPEQELNRGVVRFEVIQVRLGKVRVEGNQFFDDNNIRDSLPGLREGETPNIGAISDSLKLANDNPAKKTTLQLQSGEGDDEIDATLKVVDEKVWKAGINIDNAGNDSTGKTQIGVLLQHANVGGLDHVASLQYTTTAENPSQVSVYGVGYHIPLYSLGDAIDLFASYSDVNSTAVLAGISDFQVSGKGSVVGGRYTHSLGRAGNYDSRIIAGLDHKNYRTGLNDMQLNNVTVNPVSIAYAATFAMPQAEAGFGVTAMRNLPGGGNGGSEDFNRARAGAAANYSLLRYGASYSRALPADWQMRFSFSGQYTRDKLISGEQFGAGGAGGAGSVRGFEERALSKDKGNAVSGEIYTPNLCSVVQAMPAQCRALAFYDAARATLNDPLPGEGKSESIASVGLGLRVGVDKHAALQIDVGHVVDGGGAQRSGDNRVHFRLGLSF